MQIVVSGGGTAGHVYPALAVVAALVSAGHETTFIGTPDGMERELAADAGIPFEGLPARGFDRGAKSSLVPAAATMATSARTARGILKRISPGVVVGFGGYVSLPVGLATASRRVPLVLHEQNSVPGLANRVLSRWAGSVAVTYPGSAQHLRHPERAEVTGNPVREQILTSSREAGRRRWGIAPDETLLLVFGGSRGARHINEAVLAARDRMSSVEGLRVLHVAGRTEADSVRAVTGPESASDRWYRVEEYVTEMGDTLAAADLILSRAGATSIAEITALGRPALLVPYPYATDDHQTKNAYAVRDAGGAVVVADDDLDTPGFTEILRSLLESPRKRDEMATAARRLGRPDAARAVVDMVLRAVETAQEGRRD